MTEGRGADVAGRPIQRAVRKLPSEFADLLSPRGRRILERRDPASSALADPRRMFLALEGAIVPSKARALRDAIDRALWPTLTPMSEPIPDAAILEMTENYGERLPKTVRVKTAMLESRRARSYAVAQELGLVALLRSASFKAFAEALIGARLGRRWGIQALCYAHGDYAGPHNDHHPEEPDARGGYLDVHLTLANDGVASQFLVYEQDGHFSQMRSVNTQGGITAYKLPFWHYTTPLRAKRGREEDARRWVLLGTFVYA